MRKLLTIVALIVVVILCFENIKMLREIGFYKNLRNTVTTFVNNAKNSIAEADKEKAAKVELDRSIKAQIKDELDKFKVTINGNEYRIYFDNFVTDMGKPIPEGYNNFNSNSVNLKINATRNGEHIKVDYLTATTIAFERNKDEKLTFKHVDVRGDDSYLRILYDIIISYDYEITLTEDGIDKPFEKSIQWDSTIAPKNEISDPSKVTTIPYVKGEKGKYKYQYTVDKKKTEVTVKRTKINK